MKTKPGTNWAKNRRGIGRPFKPGQGGRPKGIPNKLPRSLKATVLKVYENMGGESGLLKWAMENPEAFYVRMIAPMLPRHVEVNPEDHARALAAKLEELDPDLARRMAEAIDLLEGSGQLH